MEAFFEHLITQSAAWSLAAVTFVACFESLALVGLIMPGTVIMAALGALIGSGQMGFWPAWGAGIIGCLIGDWVSFWLGWRFKKPLHRWSFLKKHRALLGKTEHALHQHSMLTILIGRFIGPTRPLVPMVAGMLNLPVKKFIGPNLLGCLLWPPFYFLPGILAGAAMDIPEDPSGGGFKWLLLASALLLWLASWLCWRWWRNGANAPGRLSGLLPLPRLRWLAPLVSVGALALLMVTLRHPLMPAYAHVLWRVLSGAH